MNSGQRSRVFPGFILPLFRFLLIAVCVGAGDAIASEAGFRVAPTRKTGAPESASVPLPGGAAAAEFIRQPEVRSVHLSPDGKELAYLFEAKEQDVVGILSMDDNQTTAYRLPAYVREYVSGTRLAPSMARPMPQTHTLPGGRTVITASITPPTVVRPEYRVLRIERDAMWADWCRPGTLLLSLRTGHATLAVADGTLEGLTGLELAGRTMMSDPSFAAARGMHVASRPGGVVYVIAGGGGTPRRPDVWRCDVDQARYTRVVANPGPVHAWHLGAGADDALGIGEIDGMRHVFLRSATTGQWESAGMLGPASELCRVSGYDATGGLVHALRWQGDSPVLATFDLRSRTWWSATIPLPGADIVLSSTAPRLGDVALSGAILARGTNRLLGVRTLASRVRTVWFDAALEAHQAAIDQARPGLTNLVLETDESGRRLLVLSFSPGEPGMYSLFDANTGRLTPAFRLHGSPGQGLSGSRPFRFTARDGTSLAGWLTTRSSGTAEAPIVRPLVVVVNPAPFEPWVGTYNDVAQFLASRGYLVLQLNHRGTRGRGLAFLEAGQAGLGARVPDDFAGAIDQLVSLGLVERGQVAAVGTGYGAHLALRMVAGGGDTFACGVAISPVVDWGGIAGSKQPEIRRAWIDGTGVIGRDAEADTLTAQSAVTFAAGMKTPLLLVHGAEDTTAPRRPVDRFAKRLRDAGAAVEQVMIKRGGHGIPEAEPRAEMFERIETFLAQHLREPVCN